MGRFYSEILSDLCSCSSMCTLLHMFHRISPFPVAAVYIVNYVCIVAVLDLVASLIPNNFTSN